MSMTQPATFGRRNAAPVKSYGAAAPTKGKPAKDIYAPSTNHGIHYERSADDAKTALMRVSKEKSMAIAYLLWFFLGGLGAHRFYLGKFSSGLAQAGLVIFGAITSAFIIGLPILIAGALWAFVDVVFVHRWVRRHNEGLDY